MHYCPSPAAACAGSSIASEPRAGAMRLGLLLLATHALGAPTNEPGSELAVEENMLLKLRLQALEDELRDEKRHSYVVVHGYITGSENVLVETMDVDTAKAWCNSHRSCKGFTFGGAEERPGDEVTVTFKVCGNHSAAML